MSVLRRQDQVLAVAAVSAVGLGMVVVWVVQSTKRSIERAVAGIGRQT